MIYPLHCDHMGHMNVMWYTAKFNDATWQLVSNLGLTRERLADRQLGMAALEQHISYKRELHAGDVIVIRSSVVDVRERVASIAHEMRNERTRELAATTVIVGAHFDLRTRRTLPLPEDVRQRALRMMESHRSVSIRLGIAELTSPTGRVPVENAEPAPFA
jgi:acyl-CoA thioester hydrolase